MVLTRRQTIRELFGYFPFNSDSEPDSDSQPDSDFEINNENDFTVRNEINSSPSNMTTVNDNTNLYSQIIDLKEKTGFSFFSQSLSWIR